jgi:septum formation topological specificity factor MinE
MSVLLTIKRKREVMAQDEIPKELKKKQEASSSTVAKTLEEIPIDEEQDSDYGQLIDQLRDELLSELTPIEKDVLGVAKEILKLKKYPAEISVERVELASPMVDKIYAKSIARFENQKGYKKDAIFSAIKSLETKKWIITNQRTTKAEILKNPIKKEILTFVQKYPGVHARDDKIEEILHITRNPFIKHMATLEAFGLIRSSKIGATLNYFPADLPDVFDDLAVLFQNEIVIEIVRSFITKHMTLMELAEKIGVYHRAIQYHIKTLLKNNVLMEIDPTEADLEPGEKIDSRRKYYAVNSGLLERYNRLFKIPPFIEWL